MSDSVVNIIFCGTGGQGVLTAAEICAVAAMNSGHHVKKSEVHGMAQRGGSVESHVRFGSRVHSPLIKPRQADYLVCFHEEEGKRLSFYLKKDGVSFLPFLKDPSRRPRDKRFANTYCLGILSAFLPFGEEAWRGALRSHLKHALGENEQAFAEGRKSGAESSSRKQAFTV